MVLQWDQLTWEEMFLEPAEPSSLRYAFKRVVRKYYLVKKKGAYLAVKNTLMVCSFLLT